MQASATNVSKKILKEHIFILNEAIGEFATRAILLEEVDIDDVKAWIKELSDNQTWAASRNYKQLAAGFGKAIADIQKSLNRGVIKKTLNIGKDVATVVSRSQTLVDALVRGFESIEQIVELIDASIREKETSSPRGRQPFKAASDYEGKDVTFNKNALLAKALQSFLGPAAQKKIDEFISIVSKAIKPGNFFTAFGFDTTPYIDTNLVAKELFINGSYNSLKEIAVHAQSLREKARNIPPREIAQTAQQQQAAQQPQAAQQQQAGEQQQSQQQQTGQQQTEKITKEKFVQNFGAMSDKAKKNFINQKIERLRNAALQNPDLAYAVYDLTAR